MEHRYNVSHRAVSDESGDASREQVGFWLERLPLILTGYGAQDIGTAVKLVLFWKSMPEKDLAEEGKACKGVTNPS